ncbi:MAG: 2-succinyl-5-enolpyruvyl-6-hydroxy-3-cyclohexene-1-carboxylic-acid synthase [Gemmatimonadetes bacterium]|nr:2-succinyl-5-enolpyruvyl-6-hydroxy-3-cyclohexene-1-carboxylic-acid synthase [Gemmatimonadota bacterium]
MSGSVANTLWARAFVDELARCGVGEAIVAPGSRSTPLVMALAGEERIRVRVHLDERSAAFFALGVGKASGRPAAVVTTSGTAVANLLPAVVEASQAGVPLLLLTADRPHRLRGADANQAIDQVGIFGSYPRAFHEIAPPSVDGPALRHLRSVACRAVAKATGPDAGPVHLNFPFDKPLEPTEPPSDLLTDDPLGVAGRTEARPFTRISRGAGVASDDELDALVASLDGRRGVIVAGPTERASETGPSVRGLAAATGFPVLADPLSGARYGPSGGAHVVAGYDLFLRDEHVRATLEPSLILRVGASPTSAALQRWIFQHNGVDHVVIDPGGRWKDHGAAATRYLVADPAEVLAGLTTRYSSTDESTDGDGTRVAAPEWSEAWYRAEEATRGAMEAHGCPEGIVAESVVASLPAGGTLFVSSSMPVRDIDAFAHPRESGLEVFSNRGASGIDGVVSTSFGVASQAATPVVCLLGDLAFFHDRNGLLWSREADAHVIFVLVDNDGGGIFHMLPVAEHEPEFTRLFATPHGVEPGPVAGSHGIACAEVPLDDLPAALADALSGGKTAVLHVRTDRSENRRARAEVEEAVPRSVRAALG